MDMIIEIVFAVLEFLTSNDKKRKRNADVIQKVADVDNIHVSNYSSISLEKEDNYERF